MDTADCVNAVSMVRTMVGDVGMDNVDASPARADHAGGTVM